ncbi:cupin domain-containing protein [Paraburkholderia sediminicola]|uniref:hypothetical protein n=1 Tax=Paraburkholderia sediminicola TaxID=458836 RepID=UPI0038B842E1
MNNDDEAIARLYGRAYGPAHKDHVQAAESALSAADPSRRTVVDDVNSGSNWYRPSRSIQGAGVDQSLGLRPGVAGLMPADSDYADVTADDLPEVEAVPAIDRDLRAYIESNPGVTLITASLLTGAMHLVGETTRADEMELAEAMTRLGYEKAQRRIDGARVWVWVSRTSTDAVTNLEQE